MLFLKVLYPLYLLGLRDFFVQLIKFYNKENDLMNLICFKNTDILRLERRDGIKMKIKRSRSQAIIIRDDYILMATHHQHGMIWNCLPGGGVEDGETPEETVIRELKEECLIDAKIVIKTSEYHDYEYDGMIYSYLIDIGDQEPVLGEDPTTKENPILTGIQWMKLNEICERDRAYLWAAGLICIPYFNKILSSWNDDISLPGTVNKL